MEILGNLKVRTLLDSFETNTYTVSQEEIAAYREKNQGKLQRPESVAARHILLRVNDGDDDAAKAAKKKKIEEIREQIVAGADFGEMAKQHSDCPSKEKGGDLGEFGRKQMVKPFADAAFSQEVDAVGPVVETKFGYHIIQVTKHAQPRELTDADITTVMERDKRRREIDAFVGELHAKAKIERTDGRP
ncbi:MAG: peptidylprolyl isomerase [Kiritimatiellae bacterium]|nr:peptidylprolyl isomerase [Kiritimatiellia bacterium]